MPNLIDEGPYTQSANYGLPAQGARTAKEMNLSERLNWLANTFEQYRQESTATIKELHQRVHALEERVG